MGQLEKVYNICITGTPEGDERSRKNIWSNNSWEFSKISDRHQNTDPGSSEHTKQYEYQKIFS